MQNREHSIFEGEKPEYKSLILVKKTSLATMVHREELETLTICRQIVLVRHQSLITPNEIRAIGSRTDPP